MAAGIVTQRTDTLIHTDIPIDQTKIGGPLLNLAGQVVGFATMTSGPEEEESGVALPAEHVTGIVHELLAQAQADRHAPKLGVIVQPIDEGLARSFGLQNKEGVVVADVIKDSAAEAAGIRPGDVLLSFAGDAITSPAELRKMVGRAPQNQKVDVRLVRGGDEQTVSVDLMPRSSSGEQTAKPSGTADTEQGKRPGASDDPQLGIGAVSVTPFKAEQLGLPLGANGVYVGEVMQGGRADKAGVRSGDVITDIAGHDIGDVEDIAKALADEKKAGSETVAIRIHRGGSYQYLSVDL